MMPFSVSASSRFSSDRLISRTIQKSADPVVGPPIFCFQHATFIGLGRIWPCLGVSGIANFQYPAQVHGITMIPQVCHKLQTPRYHVRPEPIEHPDEDDPAAAGSEFVVHRSCGMEQLQVWKSGADPCGGGSPQGRAGGQDHDAEGDARFAAGSGHFHVGQSCDHRWHEGFSRSVQVPQCRVADAGAV